jgi:hypothetical protein
MPHGSNYGGTVTLKPQSGLGAGGVPQPGMTIEAGIKNDSQMPIRRWTRIPMPLSWAPPGCFPPTPSCAYLFK